MAAAGCRQVGSDRTRGTAALHSGCTGCMAAVVEVLVAVLLELEQCRQS